MKLETVWVRLHGRHSLTISVTWRTDTGEQLVDVHEDTIMLPPQAINANKHEMHDIISQGIDLHIRREMENYAKRVGQEVLVVADAYGSWDGSYKES